MADSCVEDCSALLQENPVQTSVNSTPTSVTNGETTNALTYDSKRNLLGWNSTFEELREFCNERLQLDSTVSSNERFNSLKADGITMNHYINTCTLQVQGPKADEVKDRLRSMIHSDVSEVTAKLVYNDAIEVTEARQDEVLDLNSSSTTQDCVHTRLKNTDCPCYPLIIELKEELSSIKNSLESQTQSQSSAGSINERSKHITKLEDENYLLRSQLSSLKSQYDQVVEERESLKLALQLISRDLFKATNEEKNKNANSSTKVYTQDKATIDLTDAPVHNTSSAQPGNPNNSKSHLKTAGANQRKKNKRKVNNTASKAEDRSSNENSENEQLREPQQREETTTLLIGDSLVKNIQGWYLGKEVGHKVIVKPFPGANTRAMEHYMKPPLELKPQRVVLHIGTNDLKAKAPHQVADAIVDLARQVENTSDAEVVISELVCRGDKYNDAVKEVNKRLKKFCNQNQWVLIQHTNITDKGLNRGGLHLNAEGNKRFFKNFKSSLVD